LLAQLGLNETERQLAGALFGLEYVGSPVDELEGSERARAFSQMFDHLFRGLTSEVPMIFIIDDLHRADELSRRALDHVAVNMGSRPLLILGAMTGGPGELLPLTWSKGEVHELILEGLPFSARYRVVQTLLSADNVPEVLNDFLDERAGGNPLVMELLVRWLAGDGLLARDGEGRWQFAGSAEQIPSARELVRSFYARETESVQHLLWFLGVAGQCVPLAWVNELVAAGALDPNALPAVSRLAADGVLEPRDNRVGFAHSVLREAAKALPEPPAGLLRAADTLEASQDAGDLVGSLYRLWIDAGDMSRAWEALAQCIEWHIREGGGRSLLASVRGFLSRCSDPRGRARAAVLLAQLALEVGSETEVESALRVAEAQKCDELEIQYELLRNLAKLARRQGDPELAAGRLVEALEVLVEHRTTEHSTSSTLSLLRETTQLELERAQVWREAGELDEAMRSCRRALAEAEELREAPLLARCREEMARIFEQLDEGEKALRQWDLAIGIWKKIGRRRALYAAFAARGRLELDDGNVAGAKNLLRESLLLARECADVEGTSRTLHLLGRAQVKSEGLKQAASLFQESLPVAQRFGLSRLVGLNEAYLSAVKALEGDVEEGIRELEAQLARWEVESPDKEGLLELEMLLGEAYRKARRVGPTNKHYVRALQLARELHLPRYVREITREMKKAF
jgi:tetratricopeptide (TPR) repeat protein